MNLRLLPLLLCTTLSVAAVSLLQAQDGENNPQTVRTKDKRYVTTGSMTISAPLEIVRRVIGNTDEWNDWMFSGLDGRGHPDRFLLVYITGVEFPDESSMIATVEFRFLRNLGKDPERLSFHFYRHYGEDDAIQRVSAVLAGETGMLQSAQYDVCLSGDGNRTIITYSASVRLRGFFGLLVTNNTYKKNIEWYLRKIMSNLLVEISS